MFFHQVRNTAAFVMQITEYSGLCRAALHAPGDIPLFYAVVAEGTFLARTGTTDIFVVGMIVFGAVRWQGPGRSGRINPG